VITNFIIIFSYILRENVLLEYGSQIDKKVMLQKCNENIIINCKVKKKFFAFVWVPRPSAQRHSS
jgi:hypothetical protein